MPATLPIFHRVSSASVGLCLFAIAGMSLAVGCASEPKPKPKAAEAPTSDAMREFLTASPEPRQTQRTGAADADVAAADSANYAASVTQAMNAKAGQTGSASAGNRLGEKANAGSADNAGIASGGNLSTTDSATTVKGIHTNTGGLSIDGPRVNAQPASAASFTADMREEIVDEVAHRVQDHIAGDLNSMIDDHIQTHIAALKVAMTQAEAKPLSFDEMLMAVAARVRDEATDELQASLNLALLGAATGSALLSDADLEALTAREREQVKQYEAFASHLRAGLQNGELHDADEALASELDAIIGERPIEIRLASLCRSVNGYGDYEEMKEHTFIAGREQPVIIYVELDHYDTAEESDGRFNVTLTQEVVLYNDADGLPVWSHPKERIIDHSRNRRRDFFVVQLVRLPARLSVGKYQLKVRVSDENGGSVDEVAVPISVVASEAMVRGEDQK